LFCFNCYQTAASNKSLVAVIVVARHRIIEQTDETIQVARKFRQQTSDKALRKQVSSLLLLLLLAACLYNIHVQRTQQKATQCRRRIDWKWKWKNNYTRFSFSEIIKVHRPWRIHVLAFSLLLLTC